MKEQIVAERTDIRAIFGGNMKLAYGVAALALLFSHTAVADELRIASWNIANLASGPGVALRGQTRTPEDYDYLRDQIRVLGADIIALQEIGSLAGAKAVLGNTYEVVFETRCAAHESKCLADHDEIYTAIAYRKALADKLEVFQIDSMGVDHTDECGVTRPVRGGVGVKLDLGGQMTWIPSVHMKASCKDDNEEEGTEDDCRTARAQFEELAKWIKARPAGDAVIVTGDMNRTLLKSTDSIRKQIFEDNFARVEFLPPGGQRACWSGARIDFDRLKEEAKQNNPAFAQQGLTPTIYSPTSNTAIDFFVVVNAKELMSFASDQVELGSQYRLENPGDTITACDGSIVANGSTALTFADAYPSDHCPILMNISY